MAFDYILFDLDGTLTDPEEGIINSVIYALKKFNITATDRKDLIKFIGPPLIDSFMEHYGFSFEQANIALAAYREYFCETGIFENSVYGGIEDMLKALKSAGKTVVLATSKPEEYARRILEHFGLIKYFDYLAGATMDEKRSKKDEIIEFALKEYNIPKEKAVMVGDRRYDIEGAHKFGVFAVGVLFGYGTEEELTAAGADITAESVAELEKILLKI